MKIYLKPFNISDRLLRLVVAGAPTTYLSFTDRTSIDEDWIDILSLSIANRVAVEL